MGKKGHDRVGFFMGIGGKNLLILGDEKMQDTIVGGRGMVGCFHEELLDKIRLGHISRVTGDA